MPGAMFGRFGALALAALLTVSWNAPLASAAGDCDTGGDQSGAPTPIPMSGSVGSCSGSIASGVPVDRDSYAWTVYRGFDLRVTLEVLGTGNLSIVRELNGSILESAQGSSILILEYDAVPFLNPHDRPINEVVTVSSADAVPMRSVAYRLTVQRTDRATTVCPGATFASPLPTIPVGLECAGYARDGDIGRVETGPQPDAYRWYASPGDAIAYAHAAPSGTPETLTVIMSGSGRSFDVRADVVGGDSRTATLRAPQNLEVSASFRLVVPAGGRLELRLTPAQPDIVMRDGYSVDQYDALSYGPARYRLRLVADADLPPVALAGPDVTRVDNAGTGSATVQLDGSASRDDLGIVSYEWREGGSVLSTAVSPLLSFGVGTHAVDLTVADARGQTSTDTVIVTVLANAPPVAAAGPDVIASDLDGDGVALVALDARASFDAGGIVSYEWSEGGALIATGALATHSFALGEHDVVLTVMDAAGLTDSDVKHVSVVPDAPPVARILHNCLYNECAFDSRASTDDGGIVSREWLVDGVPASSQGRFRQVFPGYGVHVVELRVADARGATSTASATVSLVRPDALRPDPTAPLWAQSLDPGSTPPEAGDLLKGEFDVTGAWITATSEEIAIGIRVRNVPTSSDLLFYRTTLTMDGSSYRAVATATAAEGPAFELELVDETFVATLTGSWNATSNIVWFSIPRTAVGSPLPGTVVTGFHAETAALVSVPLLVLDTTRNVSYTLPQAQWP